jgi:hypothetical protein
MTHAIVERGNGTLEDPSKDLGMGTPDGAIYMDPLGRKRTMQDDNDERAQTEYGEDWEEIGADPSSSCELSWVVEKTPTGYRGTVRVPLDAGRCLLVSRVAPGKSADGAVKKATSAASKVLANPMVAALIPPQAKFALNLVQSEQARSIAKKLLKLF